MDITNVSQFGQLLKDVTAEHGKLDILFNNAGNLRGGKLGEITEDDYDALAAVHLKAPLFLTQAAIPYLKETRGCIINTSSASGTDDH